MTKKLINNGIYVKKSSIHGRGVFAARVFATDEIIEECCVLLFSINSAFLDFSNYTFAVGDGLQAIVLGYGSLYNHAATPNVGFEYDRERNLMVYRASRRIEKAEELFISYGCNWFKQRSFSAKQTTYANYKNLATYLQRGRYIHCARFLQFAISKKILRFAITVCSMSAFYFLIK